MRNPRDEVLRRILVVYTTAFSLFLIVFFGVAPYVNLPLRPEESIGVVQLVLPLFTGYIGLILGYYFGTKENLELNA